MSVSVIIPAYNASAFIAECLESVLAQSLAPEEIIVVDDGSTDGTAEIAESFGAPVKVLRRTNHGLAASRNFGVDHCIGDLVAFVDADDLWDADKLRTQLAAMTCRPDADLCYTGHVEFRRIGERNCFDTPWLAPAEINSYRDIFFKKQFLPSSVMIKRTTFLRLGGFAPDIKICEDTDFFLRLYRSGGRFVGCPEPLLQYRRHGSNMSSNRELILTGRRSNFKEHILPLLRGLERFSVPCRFYSYTEGELAYVRRAKGDLGCLRAMARSIAFWPFGEAVRYKVFVHMLLAKVGILRKRSAETRL